MVRGESNSGRRIGKGLKRLDDRVGQGGVTPVIEHSLPHVLGKKLGLDEDLGRRLGGFTYNSMLEFEGFRLGGVGLALQLIGAFGVALTVQANRLLKKLFGLTDENLSFRADIDEGVRWLAAVRSIQSSTR